MAITAALVKELRDRTGAGMMDCKKALVETNAEKQVVLHLKGLLTLQLVTTTNKLLFLKSTQKQTLSQKALLLLILLTRLAV